MLLKGYGNFIALPGETVGIAIGVFNTNDMPDQIAMSANGEDLS